MTAALARARVGGPLPGRAAASALLWITQPVAIGVAAASVPPLLQAAVTSTSALLLVWLWTRWHNIAVLAHDATLAPGALLGALFSLRLGLLYVAIAGLGAPLGVELTLGTLVALQAGDTLVRGGPRRATLTGLLLAGMALLGGLVSASGALAACAIGSGAAWAAEARVAHDARLAQCGGEKLLFYQLIGAALFLPVASGLAGENWLVTPTLAAWGALGVQMLIGGLLLPLLWFAPGAAQRPRPLATLVRVAPLATLVLQWAVAGVWPDARLAAAAALLTLAAALTKRRG